MAFFIHRYLPRTWTDLCAFGFLLFAIHAIGLFELLHVLPIVYSTDAHKDESFPWVFMHKCSGFFIYINVMINIYKMLTTNTSIQGKVLPSILQQGWRFCYVCEANAPPRSFHCHICKTCILKRDHHCSFTGHCVGLANQRYYLGLLFWMACAALYSCILNIDFVYHLFGTISASSILTIAFPMISWIFIHSDVITSFQVFMTSLSFVGLFMNSGLIGYHLINLYHGQCVYEKTFNIKDYDLGWKENFKLVLGSKWKISWLCPIISSPQPSDGLTFVTKKEFESTKAM